MKFFNWGGGGGGGFKKLEVTAGFSCEMGEIINYWSFSFSWVALGFKFQTLE